MVFAVNGHIVSADREVGGGNEWHRSAICIVEFPLRLRFPERVTCVLCGWFIGDGHLVTAHG